MNIVNAQIRGALLQFFMRESVFYLCQVLLSISKITPGYPDLIKHIDILYSGPFLS